MHSFTWGESNVMSGPTRSAKSISPPGFTLAFSSERKLGILYVGNLKLPVGAERGLCGRSRGPSDTWFRLIAQ